MPYRSRVAHRPLADFHPHERPARVPHTTRRFACGSARALAADDRCLAVVSDRGGGAYGAWTRPATGGNPPRPSLTAAAWHVVGGWSPDGSWLLVMRVLDNTTQDLLIVDPQSGEAREITKHAEDVSHVPAGWLADGRVLVISDEASEHLWLGA